MAVLAYQSRRVAIQPISTPRSIREVCLIASDVVSGRPEPGEALFWAGGSYEVVAEEHNGTLHVRPNDSSQV